MGRKHQIQKPIFDSADMSGNLQSAVLRTKEVDRGALFVYWTATAPVGTLEVKARLDDNSDFITLDLGATIDVSGASGNHQIILLETPFLEIRLDYTFTSGTGTLDAYALIGSKGA